MNSLVSVHCTAMQTRQQHCFLWQYSQPKAHLKLSANNLGEEDLMRPSDLFSSPPSAGIVGYTSPDWGGRTLETPPQAIHKDGLDNHLLYCHYITIIIQDYFLISTWSLRFEHADLVTDPQTHTDLLFLELFFNLCFRVFICKKWWRCWGFLYKSLLSSLLFDVCID